MNLNVLYCRFCCYSISASEDALQCQGCRHWQHRKCNSEVSPSFYSQFYKAIMQKTAWPTWFCELCVSLQNMPSSEGSSSYNRSKAELSIPYPITASNDDSDDEFLIARDTRGQAEFSLPLLRTTSIKSEPEEILIPYRSPITDDADVPVTYQLIRSHDNTQTVTDSQGNTYTYHRDEEEYGPGVTVYMYETPFLQAKVRLCETIKQFISVTRKRTQTVPSTSHSCTRNARNDVEATSGEDSDASDVTEIYLDVDGISSSDTDMTEAANLHNLPHPDEPEKTGNRQHTYTQSSSQSENVTTPEETLQFVDQYPFLTLKAREMQQTTGGLVQQHNMSPEMPHLTAQQDFLPPTSPVMSPEMPDLLREPVLVTPTPFSSPSKQRFSSTPKKSCNDQTTDDSTSPYSTSDAEQTFQAFTTPDLEQTFQADDTIPYSTPDLEQTFQADVTIPYFYSSSDSEQESDNAVKLTFTVTKTTTCRSYRTMQDNHGYTYNLMSRVGNRRTWYCTYRSSHSCLASVVQRGESTFLSNVIQHNHFNSPSNPAPTPASTPRKTSRNLHKPNSTPSETSRNLHKLYSTPRETYRNHHTPNSTPRKQTPDTKQELRFSSNKNSIHSRELISDSTPPNHKGETSSETVDDTDTDLPEVELTTKVLSPCLHTINTSQDNSISQDTIKDNSALQCKGSENCSAAGKKKNNGATHNEKPDNSASSGKPQQNVISPSKKQANSAFPCKKQENGASHVKTQNSGVSLIKNQDDFIDVLKILPVCTVGEETSDKLQTDIPVNNTANLSNKFQKGKTMNNTAYLNVQMKDWTPVTSTAVPIVYHEIDSCKKVPKSVLIDSHGYVYTSKTEDAATITTQWKCNVFGYSGRCKASILFSGINSFNSKNISPKQWCAQHDHCVSSVRHTHDPDRLTALMAIVKMMLKRKVHSEPNPHKEMTDLLAAVTDTLHESDRGLLASKPAYQRSLMSFLKLQQKNCGE